MRLHLHVDPKESLALHGTPPGSAIIPEVTAMDIAPVPPPPPPPPPPLPTPVTPISRMESTRKQRLRNLNWERIPKERVEGRKSLWSGSLTGSEDDDFLIDLHSLDELFGQKESNKSNLNRSFRSSMCPSRSPQDTCNEKISLLDSKRSMNVGIFLRQFKTPASEIVRDVRQGAGESYGAEKLAELCKLLPDCEEEARLKKFTGDRTSLREPDLFMLLLVEVKNVRLRLDAMILQQEFDPALTSLCVAARCLGAAARELLQCHKLHSILRLVLKAGNYMNAGGYAGNAAGFRIASLLKLADTKANKPGVDLLHFVAMEVVKKDEDLLTFPSQLSHVGSASRLSEESVLEDLSRLRSRVAALSNSVQEEPELDQQTRPFLEAAAVRLKEAQEEVDNMCKSSQALVEFFCEDESCFKLEEACRIFHCFCHRFQRAVLENSERERKEQKRAERQREHSEKRRSFAVCSSSELDDLESTLERNLSYTWSRSSFRRQSRRLSSLDKSLDSDSPQSPLGSEDRDLERILGLEGYRRNPVLRRHTLLRDLTAGERNGVEIDGRQRECILRPDHDGSMEQKVTKQAVAAAGFSSARLSSEDSFVSIDDKICIKQNSDESRLGIKPEELLVVETRPEVKATVSQDCLDSEEYNIQQATQADAEAWHETCHLDISPQLAQEAGEVSPSRERAYTRVGETLECHTLVKGLRSYDAMSATGPRPAPSHCSKWRKELEAEERDGSKSPQSKDDHHTPKMGTRVPTKRGLAPRNGPCNSSSVPKARVKPEPSIGEPPSTPRTPRFTPPRSTSMRSSPTARPSNIQAELKRSISTRDKPSDALVKQNRRPAEKSSPEKDKAPHYEPFIRGSPLRVTKRLAPQSDTQNPCQSRTLHSPTSATNAKTVRTAVISAAKAKTSKNTDTVSSKTSPGTRTAGPKIPRAATQPMWR